MAGFVPAISLHLAGPCLAKGDARDKPGHDEPERNQSTRMLAARATSSQRLISVLISVAKASAVSGAGSAPSCARKRAISGVASALLISALSAATTSGGVPAGATKPHHEPAS